MGAVFGIGLFFGFGFGKSWEAGFAFRSKLNFGDVFVVWTGFGPGGGCGLFLGLTLLFLFPLYTPFFVKMVPGAPRGDDCRAMLPLFRTLSPGFALLQFRTAAEDMMLLTRSITACRLSGISGLGVLDSSSSGVSDLSEA